VGAAEQGVEADEAWSTSELRSLTPVFYGPLLQPAFRGGKRPFGGSGCPVWRALEGEQSQGSCRALSVLAARSSEGRKELVAIGAGGEIRRVMPPSGLGCVRPFWEARQPSVGVESPSSGSHVGNQANGRDEVQRRVMWRAEGSSHAGASS
jgi:hypothetical protein